MSATIPRAALDFLTREVNALSSDAQERVMRFLERVNWAPGNIAQCREAVVQALQGVLPAYADAAAQAAADFYDASRELCAGSALGAEAVSGYDPAATEGAVKAFTQEVVDGKGPEPFNALVLQRIDYEIKRAAASSALANGRRDPLKPRYARVPTGAETCDFCLMLASRGFVYETERSAGGLDHWHAHCDCRIVCGWPGTSVEGYDPKDIYDRWQELIDALAGERAERNGTSAQEELRKIMRGYGASAKRAKSAGSGKA